MFAQLAQIRFYKYGFIRAAGVSTGTALGRRLQTRLITHNAANLLTQVRIQLTQEWWQLALEWFTGTELERFSETVRVKRCDTMGFVYGQWEVHTTKFGISVFVLIVTYSFNQIQLQHQLFLSYT
uniref:ABC transmembrane type-1 domain-containing protein n=1 Tax=Syphacia muris TaxID=451379 RepID=A0A0N5AKI8_9BILA